MYSEERPSVHDTPFPILAETRAIREAFEGQPNMAIGRDTSFCAPNRTGAKTLLEARPMATIPFMGAGQTVITDVETYSRYLVGIDTASKKSSQPTSGISIDRSVPLVGCLAGEIQNVKHIVPTHWVRGGLSTRATLQNIDYMRRTQTDSAQN